MVLSGKGDVLFELINAPEVNKTKTESAAIINIMTTTPVGEMILSERKINSTLKTAVARPVSLCTVKSAVL